MISIVVPVFNKERIIMSFHEAITHAMENAHASWEIVYVNNGSTDFAFQLLEMLQVVDAHVVTVELSRNWGQMGAISAGIRTAKGSAVILMDGDLQDPPELLPELIDAWRLGVEVVIAQRKSLRRRRTIAEVALKFIHRTLGAVVEYPIPFDNELFCLMDRRAVDSILAMDEKNLYFPGLRAWVGYRSKVISCIRREPAAGDDRLSFLAEIGQWMIAITSFSKRPLRLSFAFCFLANVAAVTLAIRAILAGSDAPMAGLGLAAAVFFVGGLLLLSIGVLGEYLGRVYDEVRKRPLSIISKVHIPSKKLLPEFPALAAESNGRDYRDPIKAA